MKLGFAAKTVFVGLVVIGCLTFLGFSSAPETPRTVNIVAKRFTYEPNDITIKKAEPVVLILTTTDVSERYANHILWMAVWRIILTVWDSTRKKIWLGGVVLYRSR